MFLRSLLGVFFCFFVVNSKKCFCSTLLNLNKINQSLNIFYTKDNIRILSFEDCVSVFRTSKYKKAAKQFITSLKYFTNDFEKIQNYYEKLRLNRVHLIQTASEKQAFYNHLFDNTLAARKAFRERVLHTTLQDLRRAADTYFKPSSASVGVITNKDSINDLNIENLVIRNI